MAESNDMIEKEPRKLIPLKVGNKVWSVSELADLRSRIVNGFDRLEVIWTPYRKTPSNGDARSQDFVADAGGKLIQDVAELGSPVTDTNKNVGLESGGAPKLIPEPQS